MFLPYSSFLVDTFLCVRKISDFSTRQIKNINFSLEFLLDGYQTGNEARDSNKTYNHNEQESI